MLVPRCPLVSVCAPLCVHVRVCMSAGNGGMTVGVQEIYVFKSLSGTLSPTACQQTPILKDPDLDLLSFRDPLLRV